MIIDSGISICERCGAEIEWILADSSFESTNIKGYFDNGKKIIASIRCSCGHVQSNGLIYDSQKSSI